MRTGCAPGDRVRAVINGRLRRLTIVGVALSPEYVYSIRPGELVPDDRRFGIFWMERASAGRGVRHGGRVQRRRARSGAGRRRAEAVIARARPPARAVRRPAAPSRARCSSRTGRVENELAQLQSFGFLLPLIFLGVAAFILNVALTRALALQRPQIAALKALGYSNRELGWHYLKWALAHRRGRCGDRSARRRAGWAACSSSCTTSSSAFPSCSSACRPASSPARRR